MPCISSKQPIWLLHRVFSGLLLLCSVLLSQAAYAAAIDLPQENAQQYQRQLERARQLEQQQQPAVDARDAATKLQKSALQSSEVMPIEELPCFAIHKVSLSSADNTPVAPFQFALDNTLKAGEKGEPLLGRCFGVSGINALVARVQNRIIARGYVTTRVLVGPQDLSSGHLILTVIPGRIHKIRLAADANPHVSLWNAIPMQAGDLLNLRDIEQALENLKRVPTADADIRIEPASAEDVSTPGLSDVVIQYQRQFPARVTLSADDGGTRSTGRYQGGVTVSLDSVTTLNDLLYVSHNRDLGGGQDGIRGNESTTASYAIPWDYWMFGVTASNSHFYQQVAGINQGYIFSGDSESVEAKLARLVFRNAFNKTTLSVKTFLRSSSNYINEAEIEAQHRRVAGFEYGLDQSWYLGRAVFDYRLAYRRGTGAYHSLAAPEQAFGEGTSRMRLWLADVSFRAPLQLPMPWGTQALQYSANLRAQSNLTPLTPQDRFSLGNRYTVRGFNGEQLLLGDHGWFWRNELLVPFASSSHAAYLGVDYGEVGGQSTRYLPGKQLAGAVIGLRGNVAVKAAQLNYDLFWGQPLHVPEGLQADGSVTGFNLNVSF
ncbi:ShlB/FhaC/HecB family hemolysin secretion/activation protein [Methylophilus sp. 5]|uniref:ShlB/FhaC/HecB family hemolysin secretion/activation protein n=1 Tax=Methylophilus sp. 5 TaxID=1112274 RepID=UPI0004B3372E|nr:ShlB/FhaC/HecB family hemolysin secretion/activation protein [Methylophilus sp. 5]